jgi:hypothetical protein
LHAASTTKTDYKSADSSASRIDSQESHATLTHNGTVLLPLLDSNAGYGRK